ncbi:MAG TPA: imelysin family protein [Sulfuricurvum sp.]|nr:imelysin family protein [Sulfuricurvum sp.]
MKMILKTATLSVALAMTLYAAPAKDAKVSILSNYAAIALANYSEALNDAKALESAVKAFNTAPSEVSMNAAKSAWLKARESYGSTEAFRLSNGPIDAEDNWISESYGALEGQINAWPLDENMIDYTIDAEGKRTSGNIIDTKGKFNPGGEGSSEVDVTTITVDAITALNENGGDANVATGYHAIEFLLWGQDQDYSNFMSDAITNGAKTAGQRPLSDYTTDANAERRKAFLAAASEKIVADLTTVSGAWSQNISSDCSKDATGCYRGAILGELKGGDASKNIAPKEALKQIMAGLGVFIKSELANERIAVAVLTPSEEDEHSCFSDNTHRDIAQNYQGFKNILVGQYGVIKGASILDAMDPKTKKVIENLMVSIEAKIAKVDTTAKTTAHFDYQIRSDNAMSGEIKKLKNEMRRLGDMMVLVAKANGIRLSTEEVTDPEETKL